MGKKNRAEPRPRSIEEQYDLYWKYEHYLAAKAYLAALGHELPQMLKLKYNDGTFSNWKNGIYPFDLDKIATVMLPHNVLWGHVRFKEPMHLKRICLAKTIEHIGQRDGGIPGKFTDVDGRHGPETDGLDILIGFSRSSLKARRAYFGQAVDPAHLLQAVYDDLRKTCPAAAPGSVETLHHFVRTWLRSCCDAVLVLRESFPEYALSLDQLTAR